MIFLKNYSPLADNDVTKLTEYRENESKYEFLDFSLIYQWN